MQVSARVDVVRDAGGNDRQDAPRALGAIVEPGKEPIVSAQDQANSRSIPGRNSAFASEPTARAQCGSAARWDLCGGGPNPTGQGPSLPRPFLSLRAAFTSGSG
jgi:hypothetical protein